VVNSTLNFGHVQVGFRIGCVQIWGQVMQESILSPSPVPSGRMVKDAGLHRFALKPHPFG
jgi:hypothetical protein